MAAVRTRLSTTEHGPTKEKARRFRDGPLENTPGSDPTLPRTRRTQLAFLALALRGSLGGARRWLSVLPPPFNNQHSRTKKKGPMLSHRAPRITPGSDLLSHALTHAVPSAVEGLTSVFGMGTGVTPLL